MLDLKCPFCFTEIARYNQGISNINKEKDENFSIIHHFCKGIKENYKAVIVMLVRVLNMNKFELCVFLKLIEKLNLVQVVSVKEDIHNPTQNYDLIYITAAKVKTSLNETSYFNQENLVDAFDNIVIKEYFNSNKQEYLHNLKDWNIKYKKLQSRENNSKKSNINNYNKIYILGNVVSYQEVNSLYSKTYSLHKNCSAQIDYNEMVDTIDKDNNHEYSTILGNNINEASNYLNASKKNTSFDSTKIEKEKPSTLLSYKSITLPNNS